LGWSLFLYWVFLSFCDGHKPPWAHVGVHLVTGCRVRTFSPVVTPSHLQQVDHPHSLATVQWGSSPRTPVSTQYDATWSLCVSDGNWPLLAFANHCEW
jgi:hypothetical protein